MGDNLQFISKSPTKYFKVLCLNLSIINKEQQNNCNQSKMMYSILALMLGALCTTAQLQESYNVTDLRPCCGQELSWEYSLELTQSNDSKNLIACEVSVKYEGEYAMYIRHE